VEARPSIGKLLPVLAHMTLAKLTEVRGGLGNDVIVEVEIDPTTLD
jgi:hypothetical protein